MIHLTLYSQHLLLIGVDISGSCNGFFNPQAEMTKHDNTIKNNEVFIMITQKLLNKCVIITCLLFITNAFALNNNKTGIKQLDGVSAPDSVIFFNEKGEKFSLDQFEGETILLVFWASWCSACVKEMPDLDILQKDFRKLPFKIIPVSEDYQGIEVVQKFYNEYGIRYLPIYHDYKNQLFKACQIVGLPSAILINPDGKALVSFVGHIDWHDEKVRNLLLSHIPGNYPEPKNSYIEQPLNKVVKPEPIPNKEVSTEPKQEELKEDEDTKHN